MDIPVTVNEYSVSVSVIDESVSVAVAVNTITIDVTINYGLNLTQVNVAIDAKIAEIAIPTKTSELENDSRFIDESALTKENIDGLTELDRPEFADAEITALATDATYAPAVWAYLVGLFTTVPKSVLQHIVKGWTVMQSLYARIVILEDFTVVDLTTSQSVNSVVITMDKNGTALNLSNGKYKLEVISNDAAIVSSNVATFYVNDINSDVYYNNFGTYYGINFRGGTKMIAANIIISVCNNCISWSGWSIGTNTVESTTQSFVTGFSRSSVVIESITKLELKFLAGSQPIPAGTRIKITKI